MKYEVHPAANVFPMLDDESFAALKADIEKNGQREPIVFHADKLIDGRNRAKACDELGIEPQTCELDDDEDPVAYIVSANLHRRHLTPSQRAAAATEIEEHYSAAAKQRQRDHGGTAPGKRGNTGGKVATSDNGKARDAAGKACGVSGRMVSDAKKIKAASPETFAKLQSGELTVNKAKQMMNNSSVPNLDSKAAAKLKGHPVAAKQSELLKLAQLPAKEQREIAIKLARGQLQRVPGDEPVDKIDATPHVRGKGIELAHEAIAVLKRIPSGDALRQRGMEIVADWVDNNGSAAEGTRDTFWSDCEKRVRDRVKVDGAKAVATRLKGLAERVRGA